MVDDPEDEGPEPRENDATFLEAHAKLREFFEAHPEELYYDRQLCVMFEKRYFHWLTSRALKQLAVEGRLATDLREMPNLRDEDGKPLTLRFYRHRSHRYWQRQATEIGNLVQRFSGDMGHAIGAYGEILCDGALRAEGFARRATNTREWNGKLWDKTAHNLDRVYVRDEVAYGCEIKNTLKYIPIVEREIKTRMCAHLGLKPLFVVRWLPKSHMHELIQAGGYGILFEYQLYPVGHEDLAKEVRDRLGLPAHCLREFPQSAVTRLVKLHERDRTKRDGGP